jgi:hypothetical protein
MTEAINPFEDEPIDADADLQRKIEEADWNWLIADTRGKRVLRRILALGHPGETSFTGDALAMAFREGERNVALRITARIADFAPGRLGEVMHGRD